ncbi:uncharacterized protein PITG_09668 [Phytophthora infestans T30-4]|uniref:Uncharacterized protein n=1 Tax=Phytophthora infestans (strain T30-4) TaxID=403677 RepID=D0NCI9_PHYIT|nr:uncharacterized protein PITG_09668 [Phytophthora infestans T30-4]EEY55703.1 hypothetical protein PITG_09668 [Phytophthora infestans T30-4]|eukprot:XP_002903279.1 hypothetical protein PITG_09668 [Phytophthora infestans T30-4]
MKAIPITNISKPRLTIYLRKKKWRRKYDSTCDIATNTRRLDGRLNKIMNTMTFLVADEKPRKNGLA